MKLILSTIIGGIVFFILGWLLYALLFMSLELAKPFEAIMRTPDDYKLWAVIVGGFVEAFFLAWIYPKGYQGGSPAKEGFMFGLLIGLLFAVPYIFYFWAMYPVTYAGVIVYSIITFLITIIVGLVIGLIYGKIEKPSGTATP